jgi:hypothetical protein
MIRLSAIFALRQARRAESSRRPTITGYGGEPAPAYESGPGYHGFSPGYYAAPPHPVLC